MRGRPRWSVAGRFAAAALPAPMAGLPARSAMVSVGPPEGAPQRSKQRRIAEHVARPRRGIGRAVVDGRPQQVVAAVRGDRAVKIGIRALARIAGQDAVLNAQRAGVDDPAAQYRPCCCRRWWNRSPLQRRPPGSRSRRPIRCYFPSSSRRWWSCSPSASRRTRSRSAAAQSAGSGAVAGDGRVRERERAAGFVVDPAACRRSRLVVGNGARHHRRGAAIVDAASAVRVDCRSEAAAERQDALLVIDRAAQIGGSIAG